MQLPPWRPVPLSDCWPLRRVICCTVGWCCAAWLAEEYRVSGQSANAGRQGFIVVTPLQLEGSAAATILVQRGWVPRNFQDRTALPPVDTPEGWWNCTGVLRRLLRACWGSKGAAARGLPYPAKSGPGSVPYVRDRGCRWPMSLFCRQMPKAAACCASGPRPVPGSRRTTRLRLSMVRALQPDCDSLCLVPTCPTLHPPPT